MPRLGKTLGAQRAARFYWECALLVMAKALRVPGADVFVFYTPEAERERIEKLVMARYGQFEGKFVPQTGETVPECIHNALVHLDALGYAKKFVLTTDSPTLPQDYLSTAAKKLDSVDCVIGPTWTGGYYLVGVKRPDPAIFDGVVWGSGTALGETFDNLCARKISCHMLPRWQDIDTADDLPFLEGTVRETDRARLRAILSE
jgi:hypothetical protein